MADFKQWPTLQSDKEAEDFVENADLTEYDLSKLVPIKFTKRKSSQGDPAGVTQVDITSGKSPEDG